MKVLRSALIGAYERWTNLFCASIAVTVLIIDYATGKLVEFPILYALPIGLAAWKLKKNLAFFMAMALPSIRVVILIFLWNGTTSLPVAFINAPIKMIALFIYAFLINRIALQTLSLKKEVRVLHGLLPVCASCKRIRNEKGEYEQMEKYISEHSEASFSHGLCSECVKRLYPEFYKE